MTGKAEDSIVLKGLFTHRGQRPVENLKTLYETIYPEGVGNSMKRIGNLYA